MDKKEINVRGLKIRNVISDGAFFYFEQGFISVSAHASEIRFSESGMSITVGNAWIYMESDDVDADADADAKKDIETIKSFIEKSSKEFNERSKL